ncbi:MAG: IS200/IS605 family transposase [Blastocatellia bacterium]|nr:IS200/IS605 family transposase [Blastocatellia bacterium]
MKDELESSGHSVYLLTYHIVWCVKYRRSVLTREISDRLKEILTVLISDSGCQLIEIETQIDHVHIVLRTKPTHQLSKLINSFKGVSARRLFQEFPTIKNQLWKGHMWSPSYFAVTVGGTPLELIKQYVQTQRVDIREKHTNIE